MRRPRGRGRVCRRGHVHERRERRDHLPQAVHRRFPMWGERKVQWRELHQRQELPTQVIASPAFAACDARHRAAHPVVMLRAGDDRVELGREQG
jgi:hypothetical protein